MRDSHLWHTAQMGIELFVSVLGIVIATVISVWVYRRTNPKRQLRYRVEVTPLLTTNATGGDRLVIFLDHRPVSDPQILTLTLWSTGRADIGTNAFDAAAPLTFDLGAPIVEEIPGSSDSAPRLDVTLPDKILLRPALIHRRFQSTARVIVDGTPNVRVNRVLPDIDVVRDGLSEMTRAIDTSRKPLKITPLLVWMGLLLLGLAVLIASFVIYSFDRQAYLPWGGVGIMTILVASTAIIIVGIYRFLRWVGRNVEARSGLR